MVAVNIGEKSYCGATISQWGEDISINIGKYCSIASGVHIIAGGEHNTQWVTTFPIDSMMNLGNHSGHPRCAENINIENDVWIAYGATILSGARISDGAVIGAMAVVAGYVPPYSIVIGNPCRVIKYRFSSEIIEALQEIKWWDWPLDIITNRKNEIQSSDIEAFIKKYSK